MEAEVQTEAEVQPEVADLAEAAEALGAAEMKAEALAEALVEMNHHFRLPDQTVLAVPEDHHHRYRKDLQ